MQIIRMRLSRIVDFGPVVSLIGVELRAQTAMAVHLACASPRHSDIALLISQLARPMSLERNSLVLSLGFSEESTDAATHEECTTGNTGKAASNAQMPEPGATQPNRPESPAPGAPRARRFDDALFIVNPGASNPSGIAHAIIEACREARAEGVSAAKDDAVRLMVTQLAWVCRADSDTADYGKLLAECLRRSAGL